MENEGVTDNQLETKADKLTGTDAIKHFCAQLTTEPGVYRMLGVEGEVLYVGKARNLRKRVQSYTNITRHSVRIARMIHLTHSMEATTTRTEAEALLLEATLIKKLRPKYNILLRDDKSFPFIHFSSHDLPKLSRYRGSRNIKGDFFGPFVSVGAVKQALTTVQRAFGIRVCSDNVLANRSRPCLLYQIKRCSAPCTGEISQSDYNEQVAMARRFLTGHGKVVKSQIETEMLEASNNLDYEKATILRDRLRALADIISQQSLQAPNLFETDIFALAREGADTCIQVFFFRDGMNWGNRAYFPKHSALDKSSDILSYFLGQFYSARFPPREVLINTSVGANQLISDALRLRRGSAVNLRIPQKGAKADLMQLALRNAERELKNYLLSKTSINAQLKSLAEIVGMNKIPERIEIYDNSHLRGDKALGVMVVAGKDGFDKSAYRKFNIKTAATEDDYAMMDEVLTRRFGESRASNKSFALKPDLIIIDGGRGQLNRVLQVVEKLDIKNVIIASIAKAQNRRDDEETLFLPNQSPIKLKSGDKALPLIQNLRDEAHRFAISSLRNSRKKAMTKSAIDEIPGIGAKRKKLFINHFGSVRKLATSSIEEISAVDGISRELAKVVWSHFNE